MEPRLMLEAVKLLKDDGLDCTLEHPGCIVVRHINDGYAYDLWFGDANEYWGFSLQVYNGTTSDADCIECEGGGESDWLLSSPDNINAIDLANETKAMYTAWISEMETTDWNN